MKAIFRGKRKDNNEIIEGELCHDWSDNPCIMPGCTYGSLIEAFEEGTYEDGKAWGPWYQVIPETVELVSPPIKGEGRSADKNTKLVIEELIEQLSRHIPEIRDGRAVDKTFWIERQRTQMHEFGGEQVVFPIEADIKSHINTKYNPIKATNAAYSAGIREGVRFCIDFIKGKRGKQQTL